MILSLNVTATIMERRYFINMEAKHYKYAFLFLSLFREVSLFVV